MAKYPRLLPVKSTPWETSEARVSKGKRTDKNKLAVRLRLNLEVKNFVSIEISPS